MRRRLIDAPLLSQAVSALDRRRLRRLRLYGDPRERSKRRWRQASPGCGLTWGVELSGDPAIEVAEAHGAFGPERVVLEIGPGYGRVLRSCLARGIEFGRYVGLDLSEQNAEELRGAIADPRVEIVCGDVETIALTEPVDSVLSFLTFKHLYPSFERALVNLQRQLRPGAVVLFDLIEGHREYFHRDQKTFIREYRPAEVVEILRRASLDAVAFDRVEHAPGRVRMVVVARKP